MRLLLPLLGLTLIGCGTNPGTTPGPVDISGRVTLAGKPLNDVYLALRPAPRGSSATFPLKNGEFKGQAVPGTYAYFVVDAPKPAADYKIVPEKYREPKSDRLIDVGAGSNLTINLD